MSIIGKTTGVLPTSRSSRPKGGAGVGWIDEPSGTDRRPVLQTRVLRSVLLAAALWLSSCSVQTARAQGTTVQLPSYKFFTTNTTVTVPDRGSAYLGGVNRARSGSNEFGAPLTPFRNRSSGSDRSASGMSVSVYIHDFAEMEERLLGQSMASDRVSAGSRAVAAAGDSRRAPADPPIASVEDIRRQRRLDQEGRQSEARDFFERGQAAEASGKTNVARIYYQMAAKRASGDFKVEVLAKLDALHREQATKVAQKDRPETAGR